MINIYMYGYAGKRGSTEIYHTCKEELDSFFPIGYLNALCRDPETDKALCEKFLSSLNEYFKEDECLCIFVKEGGIYYALWDMQEALKDKKIYGFNIDLRSVLMLQETIEVCERTGINPYELISDALLICVDEANEDKLLNCYNEGFMGMELSKIGYCTHNNDKLLILRDKNRNLNKPAGYKKTEPCDEIYKFRKSKEDGSLCVRKF